MKGLERDRILEEIERIYRDRYPVFLRVAASVAGNADVGHDAVQDGFTGAVRSRRSYSGRGPLEAWIWRAVVNAARDRRRSLDRPEMVPEEPGAAAEPDVGPGALRRAISRLPERQRLAIFLRYFADLDQRSIGEALGIRPGTVAATLHAARESLRTNLEEVESWQR